MKNILMSFLMMAMIAGCVQQAPTEAEKPEEPPVVEQPEKPVEQEKPEETEYVKKIDESKDWVYSQDGTAFNSDVDVDDWLMETLDLEQETNLIYINMDSLIAKEFNALNTPLENPNGGAVGIAMSDYKWFVTGDYLVILEKKFTGPRGSGYFQTNSYLFDLLTGNQIDVNSLLAKYELTLDSASSAIEEYLLSQGYEVCGDDYADRCFFNKAPISSSSTNFSSMINESSVIYIDSLGKLSVVVNINDNIEHVEIKNIVHIAAD